MERNRGTPSGLTLVELLVVIAMVAILSAILLPVIYRVKTNAKVSACISNMRQLAAAVHMYRQDWNGSPPATLQTWRLGDRVVLAGVEEYAKRDDLFACPLNHRPYHYRFHFHSLDSRMMRAHDRWACGVLEDEEPPGAILKCFTHVRGRDQDRADVYVLGATPDGKVDWVKFVDPSLKQFVISEMGRR